MPKKSEIREKIQEYVLNNSPVFSKSEFLNSYPTINGDSLVTTLGRMTKEGIAFQPWRGIYVCFPQEKYGSEDVHLREYLNTIMINVGIQYYITMFDALQELIPSYCKENTSEYQIMIDNPGMGGLLGKTSPRPRFLKNKLHPAPYVVSTKTKYGKLNIPTAELLGIDFISYAHTIGGLQESVNALKILTTKLDFERLNADIFEFRTAANIQRLGYIIENVLGMAEMAQPLHDLLDVRYNKVYARNLLASALSATHTNINKRWHLDVNVELNG